MPPEPDHEERVHVMERVPIEARAQDSEEDQVPERVREVPGVDVDDQRGVDEDVHAEDDRDPQGHDPEVVREAEQRPLA